MYDIAELEGFRLPTDKEASILFPYLESRLKANVYGMLSLFLLFFLASLTSLALLVHVGPIITRQFIVITVLFATFTLSSGMSFVFGCIALVALLLVKKGCVMVLPCTIRALPSKFPRSSCVLVKDESGQFCRNRFHVHRCTISRYKANQQETLLLAHIGPIYRLTPFHI